MVVPSLAVTFTLILLLPTTNGKLAEADPEVTAVPFTVMVAAGSLVVGVTVTEVIVLATLTVYDVVPGAKTGAKVPLLMDNADRLALPPAARVITTV